jgi:hypothetical protein
MHLAPDEASRKNAAGLAIPGRWAGLGSILAQDRRAIWGEIQGSGTDPYRCQVDLNGPGYQCSCPSKKHPCKHALGLFLLYASRPEAFAAAQPPEWVEIWLARRQEQARVARVEAPEKELPPDARSRRAADRDGKIRAGLDALEVWLRDLLRQGLAGAQGQPRAFWETAAARLVDAQAPGLARMVRSLADQAVSGEGWQERMIQQMARLYLAMEGYRRIGTLPEDTQADLRSLVGINVKQETLLQEAGVRDTWLVLGRVVEEETNLKVQRVWLWGQSTGRPALVLSFAAAGGTLDASLAPGMALPAELVFYPGAYPLRALVRSREAAQNLTVEMPGCANLAAATAGFAAALARFPWLERFPMALSRVTPLREDGEWVLYDGQNRRAALARHFLHGWTLLALSGGNPLGVFGEWNGERLLPLSAWGEGEFVDFRPSMEQP